MKNLTSGVKKLVTARWFPTFTKPIILGIVGSGIVASLSVVGVHVLPDQVEAAAAPLVGFLLTAVAQRSDPPKSANAGTAHVTVVAHTLAGQPTVGMSIASSLTEKLASAIDANPALVTEVAQKALEDVLNPLVPVPAAPAAPVPVVPEVTSPASQAAPHITQ